MTTLLTKIVGLKHRGVKPAEIYDLVGKKIRLEREPNNKFDGFAVKCLSGDRHIGYIEANQSERVTKFIQKAGGCEVEVVDGALRSELFLRRRASIDFRRRPSGYIPNLFVATERYGATWDGNQRKYEA